MIYLFLADGFEEIETIGTIDILRRCGLQVQTLSVTGKRVVTSARGVVIKADSLFRKNHLLHCDAWWASGRGNNEQEYRAASSIAYTST